MTLASVWFGGYLQREIQTFKGKALSDFYDFNVYYTAALVARSATDKNLYSYKEIPNPDNPTEKLVINPQFQSPEPNSTYGQFAVQTKSDGQYLYPPFFSIAVIPVTYLSYEKAKVFWHFFIFFLAGASVVTIVKLFYEDYLTIALISGAIISTAEFTLPMQDLFYGCNVSSVILFLISTGLYLHKKYPSLGALFFTLAVFIKLTPIVVVPLMIIRRQWRWLAAFVCWSILLFGISIWQLGWQNQQDFFTKVLPSMSAGVPHRDNRSLSTILYVVATGKFIAYDEVRQGAYLFPEKTPLLIFKFLTFISFALLLFLMWRLNKTDSQIYVEIMLLVLWSIIFSPVSLRYNYLLALSPVVFAWLHPLTKNASTFWLGGLSFGTFMIFSILSSYGLTLTESFFAQMILFMVMPTGIILCMAYLLKILKVSDESSQLIAES